LWKYFIYCNFYNNFFQSNREEYGDRGASLKAFRLDQEEAKQRIESMFGEDENDGGKEILTTTGMMCSNVNSILQSRLIFYLKNNSVVSG